MSTPLGMFRVSGACPDDLLTIHLPPAIDSTRFRVTNEQDKTVEFTVFGIGIVQLPPGKSAELLPHPGPDGKIYRIVDE